MEFACSSCANENMIKNAHVRLLGDSKLTVEVSVHVNGCLSCLSVLPCLYPGDVELSL